MSTAFFSNEVKFDKMISKTYRKKPITIRAIQVLTADKFQVETKEGIMQANKGDYLVQGIEGELYPVKKEIFEKSYEMVETS